MVEDYSGSYELAFFGKDHENFMSYLQTNNAIFIEAEIDEKYFIKQEERQKGKTSPYGFKVKKIMLLGNVTDTYVKSFSVNLTTSMLSPEFRGKMMDIIRKNPGNIPLTLFLFDPVKKWNIEFISRKFKVSITSDFIDQLQKLGIKYSVVKK